MHADKQPAVEVGTRIADRYVIRRQLGEGGVGSVYLAFDEGLEEDIAIKILRQQALAHRDVLSRFKREVRLTRRVAHPNVIRMYDFGGEPEQRLYFLTMAYVEGESLASILKGQQSLSLDDALPLLCQLCEGLMAAHDEEILHLDLKPDNILLSARGRVVITDFGIARHLRGLDSFQSHRGQMLGTPAYMAPEQFQGRDTLDYRTDMYAFGTIAYEMVTGQAAWKGDNFYAVAMGRFFQTPPDPRELVPTLPEAFARLMMQCMALKPADRYDSMQAVLASLRELSGGTVSGSLVKGRTTPESTVNSQGATAENLPFSSTDTAEPVEKTESSLDILELALSSQVLLPDASVDEASSRVREPATVGPAQGRDVAANAASDAASDDDDPTTRFRDSGDTVLTKFTPPSAALPSGPDALDRLKESIEPRGAALQTLSTKAPAVQEIATEPIDAAEAPISLAVIPFRMEPGAENEYLRTTISEELMRLLAKEHRFQVCAKGLVLPFAGTRPSAAELRKKLGVQTWLEGSLKQRGSAIVLKLKLGHTDADDGDWLWRKRFETNTVGLLETCRHIAAQVRAACDGHEPPDDDDSSISEDQSFQLKQIHALREHWFEEPARAIAIFEELHQQLPEEPGLMASGAVAYARHAFLCDEPGAPSVERAWELLRKVLDQPSSHAEAYYAMALLYVLGSSWGDAFGCLEWSLSLDAGFAEAHQMTGHLLLKVGDMEKALYHLKVAMTQAPDLPDTRWDLIYAYALSGQWGPLEEIFLWPLTSEREKTILAFQHARLSLWRLGQEELGFAQEFRGDDELEAGIRCFRQVRQTGRFTAADKERFTQERLTRAGTPRRRTQMLQELAEIMAYTGQWDECIDVVHQAFEFEFVDRNWLRFCPLLTSLHYEPRYVLMQDTLDQKLASMGLTYVGGS